MKPLHVAMLIAAVSLPLWAENWPKKGDIVYVSATLEKRGFEPYILEPCSAAMVKKATPDMLKIKDRFGKIHKLKGKFSAYISETKTECQKAMKDHGQPEIQVWYNHFTFLSK